MTNRKWTRPGGRVGVAISALLAWSLLAGAAGAAERLPLLRYSVPVPAQWQAQQPASTFRLAQFRVPAAPGASDGEVVVFHFGSGQGGSADANIARWSSQFKGTDGAPVSPKRETFTVGGLPATLVELTGTYTRTLGAAAGAPKPGQTLLATVVEAPEGNVIFQLHGDRATVQANRRDFLEMVKGWRP
ncbi:hypothetical protein JJ685_16695 [Ramlibacter monticola]|uniref:Uncharacterized protein n=1 Tax=Ramlibacter monticola TaxID=1926872 RepID=A0A937CV96_9BURK|nr:hypothetical protein [Ramlibacter monticola]MBL0392777.1 hypothetical protein [Ramlibacter monticola]